LLVLIIAEGWDFLTFLAFIREHLEVSGLGSDIFYSDELAALGLCHILLTFTYGIGEGGVIDF